ncbi:MAG: OPT/YSL family transporter [Spirochaetaceae bacterium]|nr:OPT/YSL family transporter [Spirochaetaceae bacterium]
MLKKLDGLTTRGLIIGSLGSVIIAGSTVYVALRLSSAPWTLVFAAILSFMLIRRLGKGSLDEVNVTSTVMTAGSMTAAATAFVLPALWRIEGDTASLSAISAVLALAAGAIIGLLSTQLWRVIFIEKLDMPFVIGRAAYDAIIASEQGKAGGKLLAAATAFAMVIATLRDKIGLIRPLYQGQFGVIPFAPMTLAMGFMLGPKFSLTWGITTLSTTIIVIPLLVSNGVFAGMAEVNIFRGNFGLGLMIGAAFATLLAALFKARSFLPLMVKALIELLNKKFLLLLAISLLAATALLSLAGVPVMAAFLLLLASLLAAMLASLLVGHAGINPLEVLGAVAFLLVVALFSLGTQAAVFMVAAASIAAALSGDMMNDFKTAKLLGTNPTAMLIGESVGSLVGIIASVVTLFILQSAFGGGAAMLNGSVFSAAQSNMVAAIVAGTSHTGLLLAGVAIGLLFIFLPVPALAMALGFYLSAILGLGTSIGLGGLLALILKKYQAQGKLVGAGFVAGEGLMGVVFALLMMINR